MKVTNVNNSFANLSLDDLKRVNQDSVLSDDNAVDNLIKCDREFSQYQNRDIALRNSEFYNVQDEITKNQIVQGSLIKQKRTFEAMKDYVKGSIKKSDGKEPNFVDISNVLLNYKKEIIEISDKANFSGVNMFSGSETPSDVVKLPSITLGGKNYLKNNNIDISTKEDLVNALSVVEGAITKISNEMMMIRTNIDDLMSNVKVESEFNYIDASNACEMMKSLKNEIYLKGKELIKGNESGAASNIYKALV